MEPIADLEPISANQAPVRPGDVIDGKYRVGRILGAGGMGVVVAATHLALERPIAIKFMSPMLMDNDVGVQRFLLEGRAAARLRSEHVVRVFDVGAMPDRTPYMVLEYLEGCDLEQLLKRQGRLPLREAVGYVLEACEAIAEAHVEGIVHRDLKPGNLFLARQPDGSSIVKVLDFGVSKLLPTGRTGPERQRVMTGPHVVMGSPLYSSPEQLHAVSAVDGRADVWSLGVILYELVAGCTPFAAETFVEACAKITNGAFRPLCQRCRELPSAIDGVVERALAKDPSARFQSVAELASALAAFAGERHALTVERVVNVARRASLADPLDATSPSPIAPSGIVSTTRRRPTTRTVPAWPFVCGAIMAIAVGGLTLARWNGATTHPAAGLSAARTVVSSMPSVVSTGAPPRVVPAATAAFAVESTLPGVPPRSSAASAAGLSAETPRGSDAVKMRGPRPAQRPPTTPSPSPDTSGFGGLL